MTPSDAFRAALAAHHRLHPEAEAAWNCEVWLWRAPVPDWFLAGLASSGWGSPVWWVGILSERPDGSCLASTYCLGRRVGEAEAGVGKRWTIFEFGHLWPRGQR